MISLTDAGRRGVSALIREAEPGTDQIVMRNNWSVAAVISIERLEQRQRLEDELADFTLVAARMPTISEVRT